MQYSNSFTYSHTFTTANSLNSSVQQTTAISLGSTALKTPQILSVKATGNTKLIGQITVNGKAIAKLQDDRVSLNLSSYLTLGINKIEILGSYKPETASVEIQFFGSDTLATQQIGRYGQLQQILIIKIRK